MLMPYQLDCFAYYCTTVSLCVAPGGDLDISRPGELRGDGKAGEEDQHSDDRGAACARHLLCLSRLPIPAGCRTEIHQVFRGSWCKGG